MTQREEMQAMLEKILDGVKPWYSEGKAFVKLGDTGYHYTERGCWIEGFSRVLWGLGPLVAGGAEHPLIENVVTGITNGTNPEHAEYWGLIEDGDQRIVEMAAIAFSIILDTDIYYNKLSKKAQENLCAWLDQANHYTTGDTNWNFFRVMVNLAFDKVGYVYDDTMQKLSFSNIEALYRQDGWYQDGENSGFDYYGPFALHYYGLIYYKNKKDTDPVRANKYKNRAIEFAQQFQKWFDVKGRALPFGRSLVYRFAQSSFFSIAAYADVEVLPWGQCRKIVMENLRFWFEQKIFDRDGVLHIGYTYPNLIMTEGYNSPASSYWGLKVFAALALPASHPFWTAPEPASFEQDEVSVQIAPGFIMQRIENGQNVIALSGKQYRTPERCYYTATFIEKYSKFAYSTKHAFSVSRGYNALEEGAFDSMLAVREVGERQYHVRHEMEMISCDENKIVTSWKPMKGVKVTTTLMPYQGWQIRVHDIETDFALETADGAFAIRREHETRDNVCTRKQNFASAKNLTEECVIFALENSSDFVREGDVIKTEPNTNLQNSKTYLPTLLGTIPKGKTRLITAILTADKGEYFAQQVELLPQIEDVVKNNVD